MLIENMDTSSPFEESFIETLEVSSTTSSSINVAWQIRGPKYPFIDSFRVHYQKVASTYIQYGPKLEPSETEYEIRNLVADTYYKVCLVVYRNYTSPFRECVDASTTNWQLPVSIGSSIGAVLALSMIVLIVLLSRCQIPIQYRRKKRKNSSRYDTMSSNYHDDHYDFSETVTHGNDEEFASEFDHDEDGLCDTPCPEHHKQKHAEKMNVPNGLCRNHVHPHVYQHQQQRNSLGRIHCPSSQLGHHHQRPVRAFSIQSDAHTAFVNQHFSPLAKESHKPVTTKESRVGDEMYIQKHVETCRKEHPTAKRHSLKRDDTLKHDVERKQRQTYIRQSSSQGFSFIDETQDSSVKPTSKKDATCKSSTAGAMNTDSAFTGDIKFDDLSAFGAVGGLKESFMGQGVVRHWDATKPVEMSYKNNIIGLGDSTSFEEHAL